MIHSIEPLIGSLKEARKAQKLSQRVLAMKVGLPQSHISKIEHANVNLTLSSFIEISRALELEVMLIPRKDIRLIKSLLMSKTAERLGKDLKPAYAPDKDEE